MRHCILAARAFSVGNGSHLFACRRSDSGTAGLFPVFILLQCIARQVVHSDIAHKGGDTHGYLEKGK